MFDCQQTDPGVSLLREKEYGHYCREKGCTGEEVANAILAVIEFESFLGGREKTFGSAAVEDLRDYISTLIAQQRNSEERLVAIARCSYLEKKNDLYVYLVAILGGSTVIASISDRLEALAGEDIKNLVFEGVESLPLGSTSEVQSPVVQVLVSRLESALAPELCRNVLAGNHHRIPVESFNEYRDWFNCSESIDAFLVKVHEEAVKDLEQHMLEDRLWYEQEITPDVLEFVRTNQEILSAVRKNNRLFVTKIPYSPKDYLKETDPLMKRYHSCHCPLVRSSILMKDVHISPTWCYCSAGFEKLMFDVVFGEPLKVDLLETALGGDLRCRFSIEIPEGKVR